MSKGSYKKIKGTKGIYKQVHSGCYLAMKKIQRKQFQRTFTNLFDAQKWQKNFDGGVYEIPKKEIPKKVSNCSTLKEVWESMQEHHFPLLATSTRNIWLRRYELLKSLEIIPMDEIIPSTITSWVQTNIEKFKDEDYQFGRGCSARCNLNNELNLFVTIFNWYKASEQFEKEALLLSCPVKLKHKKLGFIKPVPDKKKQIDLESAFLFFEFLPLLYRDLAMMQFYCAGRIGEICGLQWSNIDFHNRRMLIKHTSIFHPSNKTFIELKPFPKNKETRAVFITDEILEILKRRKAFQTPGCNFVFHIEGRPLNYGTVQLNYRESQRKSKVPYTGTHILRHGMAKLARQVGGGLDAVVAMTGHKDLKLADHYSKCDEEDQKLVSERIMEHIRKIKQAPNPLQNQDSSFNNVVSLKDFKRAINE